MDAWSLEGVFEGCPDLASLWRSWVIIQLHRFLSVYGSPFLLASDIDFVDLGVSFDDQVRTSIWVRKRGVMGVDAKEDELAGMEGAGDMMH